MERIDTFLDGLGLRRLSNSKMQLRNGMRVDRFVIKVGNVPLGFTHIDCRDRQMLTEFMQEIESLSMYERVILQLDKSTEDLRKMLKAKRIGYYDKWDNFFLPLDISATDDSGLSRSNHREDRSSSSINEFYIGYLFYCHDGYLRKTQSEIGKEINKSASTINFLLKNLENEGILVRESTNKYTLSNPRRYFDRWRMLVENFHKRNHLGRYSFQNEADIEKIIFDLKGDNRNIAFGGGIVDSLTEGYLNNSKSLNIYSGIIHIQELIKKLGLISNENGEVNLYESNVNLGFKNNLVNDSLICAELINSKNPRMIEAGEERLSKFINESSRRAYERINEKNY